MIIKKEDAKNLFFEAFLIKDKAHGNNFYESKNRTHHNDINLAYDNYSEVEAILALKKPTNNV